MTQGTLRLARGWSGAAAATFVAALFHMFGGGGAPNPAILLLALALSGLLCTFLAGRVLSLWRMTTGVILSQGVFHWLFTAHAAMAGTTVTLPQGAHAGHDMSSMTLLVTAGATGTPASTMNHDGPSMWLSHVLAAVITVAILRHGEVSACRLLHALRTRLIELLPLFRPTAPLSTNKAYRPATWPVLALPNLGIPRLAWRHRGPPALSLAS